MSFPTFYPDARLPGTGTSVFTVMSALAQAHGAVNLSQGFPDFGCDPDLVRLVTEALTSGHNQYAPMTGHPRLRRAVSQLTAARDGGVYDPDTMVTITTGATEALASSLTACLRPGDEVILLEPAYDAYVPLVRLAGGIPVPVARVFPGYGIPWTDVSAHITPRTRAILLNNPHNPTGAVCTAEDLDTLAGLVRDTRILVISDEAYAHITFDGRPHISLSSHPELATRTFVIGSFGKMLHVTGWKVGYCLAPAPMTDVFRQVHQFTVFATATPLQVGIASYLEAYPERIQGLGSFFQAKRDYFLMLMQGTGFEPLACEGAYFQLMRYSERSDMADTDFARHLTVTSGVACIPVSVFYQTSVDHGVVRFCFAKEDSTLEAAAHRLRLG